MTQKADSQTTIKKQGNKELLMECVFNAPRELVFRVSTDPQTYPHWWGPRGYTTTVDVMDARPGGKWRVVQRDTEGNEHAFRGQYLEVTPPDKLVQTFEYEGMPGHIITETYRFEDYHGKTRLVVTSLFESAEDLDGMIQSGMEGGARDTNDRLAEYLETLQAQ